MSKYTAPNEIMKYINACVKMKGNFNIAGIKGTLVDDNREGLGPCYRIEYKKISYGDTYGDVATIALRFREYVEVRRFREYSEARASLKKKRRTTERKVTHKPLKTKNEKEIICELCEF